MQISASMVKDLRERTGLGMMECKAALTETSGDMAAAVDLLRKKSSLKAEKKAGRTAAEGLLGIATAADGSAAALVEVNIETDFAAKNDKFRAYVTKVAETALATGESDIEKLLANGLASERETLVQEIGENITVRRAAVVKAAAGEFVGSYLHSDQRKGTLAHLKGGDAALAREIALHVTGTNPPPIVVRPDEVPADLVAKEREIYTAQAADSGKPAEIVAKMVDGRIRKYLAEISLLEQGFVKDPDTKVAKLLANAKAECLSFARLEVGEGIEKQASDFAAEVAALAKG
jgi:elongation factor Ts